MIMITGEGLVYYMRIYMVEVKTTDSSVTNATEKGGFASSYCPDKPTTYCCY